MASDLAQRLAKEWVYEVGGEADEAPLAEADARWWLRAIADVLDEAPGLRRDFPYSGSVEVGEIAAHWLRSAAEEGP